MNVSPGNITIIPEEICIEIISYLNVQERLSLADTCKRFRTLILEDKRLLRDLDFSNEAYLTTRSDIHKYFHDKNRSQHILNLNLRNVQFALPQAIFRKYIYNAINLVDINIHGTQIKSTWSLGDILRPFPNVRRLSVDWPTTAALVDTSFGFLLSFSTSNLPRRFEKLVYLSVRVLNFYYIADFYRTLKYCRELKELHITVITTTSRIHRTVDIQLTKLEIVEYYGPDIRTVAEYLVSTLPHREEWTYFQLSNPLGMETCMDGFYLERNVEVCKELLESKSLKTFSYVHPLFASELGGFVVSACLLKEVMKISQGNLPDKFCCFSPTVDEDNYPPFLPSGYHSSKLWLLKIEEAKRLLKNPRYQISYLDIVHNIEEECDAHIVASAFSSLTELVLSKITKRDQKTSTGKIHPDIQPGRSAVPDELGQLTNLDSCFSKLVEGTPHVRHLTVIPSRSDLRSDETWDLTALHLITGWKNLTSLRLRRIPIVDGKFLAAIGKQCRNLENLELDNLGPDYLCCYTNELLQMLFPCRNLREFTLRQNNIGHLLDLFLLLANNSKLKRVCVESIHENETVVDLKGPIEQLIHHCSELNKFVCLIGMSQADSHELMYIVQRLRGELKRKIVVNIT